MSKVTEQITVPANSIGKLIGKGGENIKRMERESGCKINYESDIYTGDAPRKCTLTGSNEEIIAAKVLINAALNSSDGRSYEMMLDIPLVSLFIGKAGKNIKKLQEETRATIRIQVGANKSI